METAREFQKTLLLEHPTRKDLKVGQKVQWVNPYGIKWQSTILGFDKDGRVYFDDSAYWFGHDIEKSKIKPLNT